jgi:hypothetical protein
MHAEVQDELHKATFTIRIPMSSSIDGTHTGPETFLAGRSAFPEISEDINKNRTDIIQGFRDYCRRFDTLVLLLEGHSVNITWECFSTWVDTWALNEPTMSTNAEHKEVVACLGREIGNNINARSTDDTKAQGARLNVQVRWDAVGSDAPIGIAVFQNPWAICIRRRGDCRYPTAVRFVDLAPISYHNGGML